MVPQPVKAIVVLFPITDLSESKRKDEDARLTKEGQPTVDSTVLWIKQTVCGSMRDHSELIHNRIRSVMPAGQWVFSMLLPMCARLTSLFPSESSHLSSPMSLLSRKAHLPNSSMIVKVLGLIVSICHVHPTHLTGKSPEERAKLLETTEHFASIHADAASSGQTVAPTADSKTNLHFTCFVQAPSSRDDGREIAGMRVIELDGRRDGPIDRGPCTDFLTVRGYRGV